jgi:tetratricopeptide (TPR) repeat protein
MNRFQEAMNLIDQGRLQEAKDVFEEILSSDPRNVDALYNLGMCFTDLSEPDKAIKTLEQCIRWQPDLVNAHVALGVAYSRVKSMDKAKDCFLAALRLDAMNTYALRNLGGLFGEIGEVEKSLYYLQKAYEIDPSDPSTVYGLGYAYQMIGDREKADSHYRQVLTINAPEAITDLAKDGLRELAVSHLKSKGFRMDAVFYLLDALRFFEHRTMDDIKRVSFEIARKGQGGLDINNPDKVYVLNSLEGQFTGLHLVCYMYVGFAKIEQSLDVGVPLADEYRMAQQLFKSGDIQ